MFYILREIVIIQDTLENLETKNNYNIFIQKEDEMPVGFNRWKTVLNIEYIKSSTCNILKFVYHYLKENKYKVFRWKL